MLSLVQEHLLGFLSSRSISKTRPAEHIFAVWFALATALLHQQNVTKTINNSNCWSLSSAHEAALRLPTLYLSFLSSLVALWCQLSPRNCSSAIPNAVTFVIQSVWAQISVPKTRASEDRLQRWESYPDDQRHPTHQKRAWHHLLYFMIRLEYQELSELWERNKTNVQIHLRKLQTAVFYNQTRQR